jgi:hypothetical protein
MEAPCHVCNCMLCHLIMFTIVYTFPYNKFVILQLDVYKTINLVVQKINT